VTPSLPCLKFGSSRRLTLQGLPFRLAEEGEAGEEALAMAGEAELVDGEAEEEDHAGDVGFGFGDGYDFGASSKAGFNECPLEAIADEAGSATAVEADIGEVGRKGGVVSKDKATGVLIIVDWIVILGGSTPIPNGEVGACRPGTDAAEAEGADETGEVDSGVGAERQGTDRFVEVAAHGQSAAAEVNGCIVVDSACGGDEEGSAGDIDDCAVAHGSGGSGLQCAAGDGGCAGVGIRSIQSQISAAGFDKVGSADGSGEGGVSGLIDGEGLARTYDDVAAARSAAA